MAGKYYEMILMEDPNSWEASPHNVCCRAINTKIAFIANAGKAVNICLTPVFNKIKKTDDENT